jgi:hypothetical protein
MSPPRDDDAEDHALDEEDRMSDALKTMRRLLKYSLNWRGAKSCVMKKEPMSPERLKYTFRMTVDIVTPRNLGTAR